MVIGAIIKDYKSETDSLIESSGGEGESEVEECKSKEKEPVKVRVYSLIVQDSKPDSESQEEVEQKNKLDISNNTSKEIELEKDNKSEGNQLKVTSSLELRKIENKDESMHYDEEIESYESLSDEEEMKKEELKDSTLKDVDEEKLIPKRVMRKRNREQTVEKKDSLIKSTPKKGKRRYTRNSDRISNKKNLRTKKSAKGRSDSSISHSHNSSNLYRSNVKTKTIISHREKTTKITQELQRIALIRTKLDNVMKEKFTSIDISAEENSNKIFEDFQYLKTLQIDIKSL